ncbi:hypothetical protein FOA52_014141 [Chlamydomonas sp. UWO 241]|nr:hypothetical protein FOA52_014141 [Chlamydomonas sp. UWO 241]
MGSSRSVSGAAGDPLSQSAAHPTDPTDKPQTPWVRQVISGVDLMRHPKYNKGMAFSDHERDRLYLRGLLPPAILSQEVQVERIMLNLRGKASDLEKHNYLMSLQDRNQRLFYKVLSDYIDELLPIMHTPTVQEACNKDNLMFKSVPRAMFITLEDRGRVNRILKNWPERNVQLVVLSDGECMGSVGDVGVQAIANPISKLSLYTACAGISPQVCLPIVIDTGTDNEELLSSPFYVGVRHRRVRGDAYYELLDELMVAIKRRYGNKTLIHFEDMSMENSEKMLSMYRPEFPCFSDEHNGTAAVVLAAVLGGEPKTGKRLEDHTFMFCGRRAQVAACAEFMASAIADQTGTTVLEARQRIWLVDEKGLVTRERGDAETLDGYKLPFAHSALTSSDLLSAVRAVQPSVLVGLTPQGPPPFKFTREVCAEMAAANPGGAPIIMPLSQGNMQEAKASQVYEWTGDRALVATDCKAPPVTTASGATFHPSMCSSVYIFPGMGMGTIMSGSTKLRDMQFIAAAQTVARAVTNEDLARGALLPPISSIREVSAHVAQAVAQAAYQKGDATSLPKPHNLMEKVRYSMYYPQYRTYR